MHVRTANAPVSYGIYSPDTAPLAADELLAAFRTAGYAGTDSGPLGYLGEGGALARRLAAHGLRLAGGWADLRYGGDRDDFAADLRTLDRTLDTFASVPVDDEVFAPRPTLACPAHPRRFAAPGTPVDPALGLTDAEWEPFAADVQAAADRCRERGLEPVFHPHLGTVVETPEETRRLLSRTDVSLCLDTGHWWLAGGDPAEAVAEWGPRIRQVHLKDADRRALARVRSAGGDLRRVVAEGGFRALGEGEIDLAAVVAALRRTGYAGWLVVEQDAPPTGQDLDRIAAHQSANRRLLQEEGL
ncbi:sugar phosphate isomerase/epimerase [Streptomyces tubbatahanensis]|uniref:Sugar phosphate isomerase/epimerase n=1 Tax=Streptomyces tubbatahanensis TaxID=2923272 RepID=A0ABY3XP10_9ACTN|nr:sugar phosphate isomerase/epimerase [Streptomyces tubbatahanensis]UNS96156.1 sugar phosphate isomerase/epimerase [Streptomyces tubbatahanensis]